MVTYYHYCSLLTDTYLTEIDIEIYKVKVQANNVTKGYNQVK